MSKLTVVYLKDTGHVLAALTRADPPTAGEPVGALVNNGLPVSAVGVTAADFTVPVKDLAILTVDDDQPGVLTDPQNFEVAQDPQTQTLQVKTGGVPGSSVTFAIDGNTGASVTVTSVFTATSLPTVVVLQKVTSPTSAPTILAPVPVAVDSPTVVAGQTGFATGDKWNMYAFVQGLLPAAQIGVIVT